ncbi:MAG: ABC transporter substrate-binding protein [Sphaerochaetaceae bacterium]
MKNRRVMAIAAVALIAVAMAFAQAAGEKNLMEPEQTQISVIALKGPTGMGLSKLISDSDAGQTGANSYEFTLAGAVDEVTAHLIKGDVDIAAVPANLASVLYSKTNGKVEVVAINTLGVIYIVEKGNSIKSVADLKGKTIYASGKGATPEYALNYILSANGIDPVKDVDIQFKSEHAECVAAITAADSGIAMLPEPFVTTSQMKNPAIHTVLDLTEEWDKLQDGKENPSAMVTGVIVGTKDFLESNPEAVSLFLDQYKESVDFVNGKVEEAAKIIGNYGIVAEQVALKAIPNCNIVFIEGKEMKTKLSGYLAELYRQNPAAVGGKLPDDAFYYSR